MAILLGALPLSAATAQPEDLRAAIDAYLAEDYSRVDVIAAHADDGVPEAVAILGQAYFYGYGLEIDRPLGVALLEQAASMGERSSKVYLGRIFEFGAPGIPADPDTAAKWYVEAAAAGDTASAPAALKRLPRDLVIAAGGEAWAAPEQDTPAQPPKQAAPAISASPLTEATRTVFDSPVAPAEPGAASPPSGSSAEDAPTQQPQSAGAPASPASAILGTDAAPPPLTMNDGTNFPIFADTRLNATGDAAASCLIVLKPEIERQKLALETLMKLDGATAVSDKPRYEELASTDNLIADMSAAMKASEAVLSNPRQNGGLTGEAVRLALIPHRDGMEARPSSGPTATLCGQRLIQLIGEQSASQATE